jgi:hydroxypyruvate isomerase
MTQSMEGDMLASIRANHQYIGHYHTDGVPGRAEIDDTREINYPAVMKAIIDTGFKGFCPKEFIPKRPDPLASLKQGVEICDV